MGSKKQNNGRRRRQFSSKSRELIVANDSRAAAVIKRALGGLLIMIIMRADLTSARSLQRNKRVGANDSGYIAEGRPCINGGQLILEANKIRLLAARAHGDCVVTTATMTMIMAARDNICTCGPSGVACLSLGASVWQRLASVFFLETQDLTAATPSPRVPGWGL